MILVIIISFLLQYAKNNKIKFSEKKVVETESKNYKPTPKFATANSNRGRYGNIFK